MIKSILLTSLLLAFVFITLPISNANACGNHKKNGHTHGEEPCEICLESERQFEAAKKANAETRTVTAGAQSVATTASGTDHSKKGSFTFKSKSRFSSKESAQYN